MRAALALSLSLALSAPPAAAAGRAGLELDLGLGRGPFRYEGQTGQGDQASADTSFESLALGVGAHAGAELDSDYFVGARLSALVLPTLSGGVQSTRFNGGLGAHAELGAWRAPKSELNFGLWAGLAVMDLAYSVDEAALESDIVYEDETLVGPIGELWVAHPFGQGWSVGAGAGFGWLTAEHARFAMFTAALRLSYQLWGD
jgi:hypothetical protein